MNTTTITDFYKFVEKINHNTYDSFFLWSVLDYLKDMYKERYFDVAELENHYYLYSEGIDTHSRFYTDHANPDYPAKYSRFFYYNYSFMNLVRDFTKATDYNRTETDLISDIEMATDEAKKNKTEYIYSMIVDNYPIDRDIVKNSLLGDDNIDFRDFRYCRPLLKKVKAEIEDMIDEGLINTEKDLWDNWLKLIEIDLIPQIKNPVHLYEFWDYVVYNIYSEYENVGA